MDEETKKAIADAVADATKALKDKNAELIGEVRKLKSDKETAEAAAEEAANEAATKTGDIEAIKASLTKKHDAEIKKLTDQLTRLNGDLSAVKIDAVISAEIAKAGVLPHHADILTTFLKAGATMKDGEAVVGDKALNDHLNDFFASDAAKHYVAAPQNSGAGAMGSTTGASNTHGFTKETLTLTAFSKIANEKGSDVANSIAAAVGSNLKV
jgi:hypothetical protein